MIVWSNSFLNEHFVLKVYLFTYQRFRVFQQRFHFVLNNFFRLFTIDTLSNILQFLISIVQHPHAHKWGEEIFACSASDFQEFSFVIWICLVTKLIFNHLLTILLTVNSSQVQYDAHFSVFRRTTQQWAMNRAVILEFITFSVFDSSLKCTIQTFTQRIRNEDKLMISNCNTMSFYFAPALFIFRKRANCSNLAGGVTPWWNEFHRNISLSCSSFWTQWRH